MSTSVYLDTNHTDSVSAKLAAQETEARRAYDAIVARVAGGGDTEPGDLAAIAAAGRSLDDFRCGVLSLQAESADAACREEAERLRAMIPAAFQLARQPEANWRNVSAALGVFANLLIKELRSEVRQSQSLAYGLQAAVTFLNTTRNRQQLDQLPAAIAAKEVELKQVRAAFRDIAHDKHLLIGWKSEVTRLEGELAELRRHTPQFVTGYPGPLPSYTPRELRAMIAVALDQLPAEQLAIVREVSAAVLERGLPDAQAGDLDARIDAAVDRRLATIDGTLAAASKT